MDLDIDWQDQDVEGGIYYTDYDPKTDKHTLGKRVGYLLGSYYSYEDSEDVVMHVTDHRQELLNESLEFILSFVEMLRIEEGPHLERIPPLCMDVIAVLALCVDGAVMFDLRADGLHFLSNDEMRVARTIIQDHVKAWEQKLPRLLEMDHPRNELYRQYRSDDLSFEF